MHGVELPSKNPQESFSTFIPESTSTSPPTEPNDPRNISSIVDLFNDTLPEELLLLEADMLVKTQALTGCSVLATDGHHMVYCDFPYSDFVISLLR